MRNQVAAVEMNPPSHAGSHKKGGVIWSHSLTYDIYNIYGIYGTTLVEYLLR